MNGPGEEAGAVRALEAVGFDFIEGFAEGDVEAGEAEFVADGHGGGGRGMGRAFDTLFD